MPSPLRRMRGAITLAALMSTALLTGACSSRAEDPAFPATARILDRYVETTGGREALLRHKSMTIRSRDEVPARKLKTESVSYLKGGKTLQKTTVGGKVYLGGYDGKVAWEVDPTGKVTLHHGDEIKSIARDADIYYHLHVMDYFDSLDVKDVKDFNGRPCYHLKGINRWGRVNEHFYDKESGLLLGYSFNTAWRGGKGDATVTFEDYKDYGGVRMAAKTTSRDGDDLAISFITSITWDDVDDAILALPEAVKKAAEAATNGS
jgi:hypothetical protein